MKSREVLIYLSYINGGHWTKIYKDLEDIKKRGFGSVEAVSMRRGIPDDFFTRENLWGSEKWIEKTKAMLHAANTTSIRG